MPRGQKTQDSCRLEAVRLRKEEQRSLGEIAGVTGISKTTLSVLLRQYPLPSDELRKRKSQAAAKTAKKRWDADRHGRRLLCTRCSREAFHATRPCPDGFSRHQKMCVSEAAAILRLSIHGFSVFGAVFDSETVDLVVRRKDGPLWKLQVKWVKHPKVGAPTINLLRYGRHGNLRRYLPGDFDFILGYDYHTDLMYVYSCAEVGLQESKVSLRASAMERWDKLNG